MSITGIAFRKTSFHLLKNKRPIKCPNTKAVFAYVTEHAKWFQKQTANKR